MRERETSPKMAHLAGEIMRDPRSTELEKSLAGSVLSEVEPDHKPSETMIAIAAQVMSHSHDFSKNAVSLAASIVSQAK